MTKEQWVPVDALQHMLDSYYTYRRPDYAPLQELIESARAAQQENKQ